MMQLQVKDDDKVKINKQHLIIKYKGKANWKVDRRYKKKQEEEICKNKSTQI